MSKVILDLNTTITRLAGNEYGQRIFIEQVKDKINYNKENIIIFPDIIENIAISFVQGFAKEIIRNVSTDKVHEIVKIEGRDKVVSNFYKYMLY